MATTTLVAIATAIGGGYLLIKSFRAIRVLQAEEKFDLGETPMVLRALKDDPAVRDIRTNLQYSAVCIVGAVVAISASYLFYPAKPSGEAVAMSPAVKTETVTPVAAADTPKLIDKPMPEQPAEAAAAARMAQLPVKLTRAREWKTPGSPICQLGEIAHQICVSNAYELVDPRRATQVYASMGASIKAFANSCSDPDKSKAYDIGNDASSAANRTYSARADTGNLIRENDLRDFCSSYIVCRHDTPGSCNRPSSTPPASARDENTALQIGLAQHKRRTAENLCGHGEYFLNAYGDRFIEDSVPLAKARAAARNLVNGHPHFTHFLADSIEVYYQNPDRMKRGLKSGSWNKLCVDSLLES